MGAVKKKVNHQLLNYTYFFVFQKWHLREQ
jgi:hypothetical protein